MGPNPKFPRPNFLGNSFRSKYRLVGCPDSRSGMPGSSSTVIAYMEPPSSRKQAKKVRLGSKRSLLGPWKSLKGHGGPDLVPTALEWSDGVVKLRVTTHFDLISGPLRVRRGPKGAIWAQSLNFHGPIFGGIFLFQI